MSTIATRIEWCDATWNPVRGCSLVSDGCRSCYAMKQAHRFSGPGGAYEGLTELGPKGPRWTGKVVCVEKALDQPLRWKTPRRIFVNSMSDLFHEDVPDAFIDRVFAVMAMAPQHTFQILTKRAERMHEYLNGDRLVGGISGRSWRIREAGHAMNRPIREDVNFALPLSNVWLGPSVENHAMADKRFPIACALGEDGWNVMVSMEPLLGAVTIPQRFLALGAQAWIVIGGESGPRARPFDLAWARSIVAQCQAAGVPVFVKQLGAKPTCAGTGEAITVFGPRHKKGGAMEEWPADLRVREFPEHDDDAVTRRARSGSARRRSAASTDAKGFER